MRQQRGMALMVMLMVVGVLGAFFALRSFNGMKVARDTSTQTTLAQARDALMGFAIVNGRLPCPAPATAVTGTVLAGLEPTPILAAGCANLAGVLPWATLGIHETDAWGNRLTYRVTSAFTKTTPPFSLTDLGDMTVRDTVGGATLASSAPAVIVSHGKNGNGAFTPQGVQLTVGADADELENQLTPAGTATANTVFISKILTPTFDDSMTWVALDVLMARMTLADKLP